MAESPKPRGLFMRLVGAVDRHVKQRPRDAFIRNALDDPAEPYVQRVAENDACAFCNKHANARPVNPRKASEKFHRFCKCHFLLFFQESRYGGGVVSDSRLRDAGISIEDGAKHDMWEKQDALILAASGRRVKLLDEAHDGTRRSDTEVDGEPLEFKNPAFSDVRAVERSIFHVLYGRNKKKIKPQSDKMLVSNARNSMNMHDMELSLEYVLSGKSDLTDDEISYIKEITLLDVRTRRYRTYEL